MKTLKHLGKVKIKNENGGFDYGHIFCNDTEVEKCGWLYKSHDDGKIFISFDIISFDGKKPENRRYVEIINNEKVLFNKEEKTVKINSCGLTDIGQLI
jgi:hypothetical protein